MTIAEKANPGVSGATARTTRRTLWAWSAAGAVPGALLAAACAARGEQQVQRSDAEAPPATPRAGTTLSFWNGQGGQYPALMQRWADAFQQKSGVKVEVSGGVAGYQEKLSSAFAAGAPPDIFRYHTEAIPIPAAVERGMLLALDPYFRRDKYDLADFRKEAVELYRWKGSLYAIPRDYGLQLIFYNPDLFAREGLPPIPADWNDKTWTFDTFLDAARRLARSGERYALFVNRADRIWGSFVYCNGGAVVKQNQDGLATEIALQEQPAVEALQLLQDLIYRHKVAPTPAEEATLGMPAQLLQNGQLAMWLTNPSGNQQLQGAGTPYEVGVLPLGRAARRGTGGGGTGWGIAAPTKGRDEAWAFVASISSAEGQLAEVAIKQTTPSRISVATSKEYLTPPPKNIRTFADGQEYVVRDPVHARWPDIDRDVTSKLLADEFWTGTSTAVQVARAIKERADPLLRP